MRHENGEGSDCWGWTSWEASTWACGIGPVGWLSDVLGKREVSWCKASAHTVLTVACGMGEVWIQRCGGSSTVQYNKTSIAATNGANWQDRNLTIFIFGTRKIQEDSHDIVQLCNVNALFTSFTLHHTCSLALGLLTLAHLLSVSQLFSLALDRLWVHVSVHLLASSIWCLTFLSCARQ